MYSVLQAGPGFLAAFFVATTLIPAIKGPAHRFGLIDRPDHRKRHLVVTPLTGGLGIFAGFIVGMMLIGMPLAPFWTLVIGMTVLLLTGLADDLINVSATARILIQIGVGCLMVYGGGLEVSVLGPVFGSAYGTVGLGPFSAPFTVACVVFTINAINMCDGLDGLAGGTCVCIFILLALVGWMDGAPVGLISIALLLALSTMGFLIHNMRVPNHQHARAFLGDTGSMMLGYAIAWLAVAVALHPEGSIYPVTIAWVLIVPGMDTLALFFRRIHLGRSPFAPDRTHLHHILRRCGYGVTTTVHMIHLLVLATGLFGILAWQYQWPQWPMFVGAAGIFIGYQVFLTNARHVLRWHKRRAKRLV